MTAESLLVTMRLKSAIWVGAYLRRVFGAGAFAAVRRRGAEEAGAIFIKINRLDGTCEVLSPAQRLGRDAPVSDLIRAGLQELGR